MIYEAYPFQGLSIRIPIIIPIQKRGLSITGLGYKAHVHMLTIGDPEHGISGR